MTAPRPMKLPWFHILLALREGRLHGYGIQRAVMDRTDGTLHLWPATLYRLLGNLEDDGLIEASPGPDEEETDQRRQYYTLTQAGRERLRLEAERMARWAQEAFGAAGGGEGA